ncbi:hypothetical protein ACTD5D_28675 [Nocardia takedensis]|uniref:hypothetical protein n=1 Tax=Nocardia takedensis TaxID=259390 RepID=UPI000316F455|nr:hypothetical protein [Nocardia takedensis]
MIAREPRGRAVEGRPDRSGLDEARYGIVVTAFSATLAWLYVWLRYFQLTTIR